MEGEYEEEDEEKDEDENKAKLTLGDPQNSPVGPLNQTENLVHW